MITAIREIVGEVKAEWQEQLGDRQVAQLRNLLTQLQPIATGPDRPA